MQPQFRYHVELRIDADGLVRRVEVLTHPPAQTKVDLCRPVICAQLDIGQPDKKLSSEQLRSFFQAVSEQQQLENGEDFGLHVTPAKEDGLRHTVSVHGVAITAVWSITFLGLVLGILRFEGLVTADEVQETYALMNKVLPSKLVPIESLATRDPLTLDRLRSLHRHRET